MTAGLAHRTLLDVSAPRQCTEALLSTTNPQDAQLTPGKALQGARMGPKHQLPSPVEPNHGGAVVALPPRAQAESRRG